MESYLVYLIVFPVVFLVGSLLGWLAQGIRVKSLKERLEDKSVNWRESQRNVGKMREELKLAGTRLFESEERIAQKEKELGQLRTELLTSRKQLASRDAVWRDRLALLQQDFNKKQEEFNRISAMTAGSVPLRTQLQRREEEVRFLKMQIEQILAVQSNGLSPEDARILAANLISTATYKAELSNLEKRNKLLEGQVAELKETLLKESFQSEEILVKNGKPENAQSHISPETLGKLDPKVLDKIAKEIPPELLASHVNS